MNIIRERRRNERKEKGLMKRREQREKRKRKRGQTKHKEIILMRRNGEKGTRTAEEKEMEKETGLMTRKGK